MNQPILSTELVLEAPEHLTDTGGGVVTSWEPVGTIWAEVEGISGREAISGGREAASGTHRITMRSAPLDSPRRPRPDCRFRSGNKIFAIRGVAEADPRRKYLTCWAEEGPFS